MIHLPTPQRLIPWSPSVSLVLLVIFSLQCTPNRHQMNTHTSSKTVLDLVNKQTFASWQGLPDSCDFAFFQHHFEAGDAEKDFGLATIGTEFQSVYRKPIPKPEYASPSELYYGEDQIWKWDISFSEPNRTLITAIKKEWGDPDAVYPFSDGISSYSTGQWVYPGRGLALFCDPESSLTYRISLFAPCSQEQYEQLLQPNTSLREFPAED